MNALGVSLFLALAQGGVWPPTVDVRASTSNVSIGERFQVTVEARGPSGTSYEFPPGISTGSVELIQSRPSTATAATKVYDAQVFTLGADGRIPPIEIQYKAADGSSGKVKTEPLPLNIISSLDPNEKNPAAADFAPPVPVLVSRAFWIASGAAGLLVVISVVLLVRRLRFPKKPSSPTLTPAVSPEEEALVGLDQLALARIAIEPKAFYIRLVQILKQYLERRLDAPILEMTSTETMTFVKAHSWTAPHSVSLRDLVTTADLVKFSRSAEGSSADGQIQMVRELVGRVDRLRRFEIEMRSREINQRGTA